MTFLSNCVLIVDKDRIVSKKVIDYHIYATQDLINRYFDGTNIKDPINNRNGSYKKYICEKFNIILMQCLNNYFIIYIPDNINEYQYNKFKELYDYVDNYNNKCKRNNDIKVLLRYNNSYYYSIEEVLNLISLNKEKKVYKRDR